MLARLALLFIVIPLLELALLIQLGRWVGFWPTLGLVIFTGIAGAALTRAEGLRTFLAFQKEVGAGRLPGGPILDGLAILLGGALLLTPGLLTDIVGFSLLLPPSRGLIKRRVRRWLTGRLETGELRVGLWTSAAGHGGPAGSPGSAGPSGPSTARPGPSEDAVAGSRGRELDPRHEILQDEERDGA